ncbi:uncharacterized protein H6S33_008155 [Morchella sextelata]|uniref:uncharacterized protein n=1 Tax=Morchella sextelata TaxID=1174677 RepID=UPI001D03B4E7|nr:uncharacterized protein H6S33_008155 [Morchella sextelata]KAH0603151.1 hypothetical protein H6S33_008155 [Morchella sextelata]
MATPKCFSVTATPALKYRRLPIRSEEAGETDYDDALENDHESSEEDVDEPKNEPQVSPPFSIQRTQSVRKSRHTVQPSTARTLGNARRKPTGAVAEVIAPSDVLVDVVQVRLELDAA